MKVKYINAFLFDQAKYNITGESGDKITLSVDYKNNKYFVNGKIPDKKFQQEIKEIAEGLLKRKHKVNFAEK